MKAAVLYEPNTPLRIEAFELPETGPTHVRVKLVASGVCHLEAAEGRYLPMMVEQIGTPFWADPSDPHRRPALEQLAVPSVPGWGPIRRWQPNWDTVQPGQVLAQTVHRVVAEGIAPERAVEEAIARIKQILAE